jgi:hypothetical protein
VLKIIDNLNLDEGIDYADLVIILKEKFGNKLGSIGNSIKAQQLYLEENQS